MRPVCRTSRRWRMRDAVVLGICLQVIHACFDGAATSCTEPLTNLAQQEYGTALAVAGNSSACRTQHFPRPRRDPRCPLEPAPWLQLGWTHEELAVVHVMSPFQHLDPKRRSCQLGRGADPRRPQVDGVPCQDVYDLSDAFSNSSDFPPLPKLRTHVRFLSFPLCLSSLVFGTRIEMAPNGVTSRLHGDLLWVPTNMIALYHNPRLSCFNRVHDSEACQMHASQLWIRKSQFAHSSHTSSSVEEVGP